MTDPQEPPAPSGGRRPRARACWPTSSAGLLLLAAAAVLGAMASLLAGGGGPPLGKDGEGKPAESILRRGLQSFSYANLFFWNLRQAAKVVMDEQAAMLGIDEARAEERLAPLEPYIQVLGVRSDVTQFNAAWEGFWLRNGRTCLATDTEKLIAACASRGCQTILLRAGTEYALDNQIVLNTSKTIIGNPADRPIINAAEAERAFWVRAGNSLDVRHILFYEGDGDVWRNEIRTRFGGVLYLSRGSTLFAFDCLFTIQPERETIFNSMPEFIFGGDILNEGGTMTIIGCSFFAIVPGFINSVSTEIGGSVLLLGGTSTFSLVNFMTSQIFAWNVGAGMHLCVLGGAVVMTGCTHTANLVFAAQGLVGRNIAIGAGVGIFTGIAVTDTMSLLSFAGAGLSIFVGAGLGVFTGCEITLINALSQKAGVGVGVALGAGMALFYGVPFAKDLGITQFNTLGVFVYVGTGRMAFIGCPFAHSNAIAAWELLGGAIFLGAGQAVLVGCAFARQLGIDFFVGLGGDIFVGAGQLVYVGSAMTTNDGIGVFIGQGTELWLGGGSAFIEGVSFSVNIGVHYYTEGEVGFWVNGRECQVTTFEEEGHVAFFEKGYATCKEGAEHAGAHAATASTVVVRGLSGTRRLGGWRDDVEPMDTSPAVLYVGGNVSACALCGLENVAVTGPGAGDACPPVGEETQACPESQQQEEGGALTKPLGLASVLAASSTGTSGGGAGGRGGGALSQAFTVGGEHTTATTGASGGGSKGLFGFGGRLRKLLGEAATTTTSAAGGQQHVFEDDGGKDLPDTHVIVADLVLRCRAGGCGSASGGLQALVEAAWLAGLDDEDARLQVTGFKSPEALMATLGIPSMAGNASSNESAGPTSSSSSSSSSCPEEEAYAVYAHTTDKAVAEALKRRLQPQQPQQPQQQQQQQQQGSGGGGLNATLAAALTEAYGGAFCGLNLTMRQSFFVPAPAADPAGTTAATGGGGADFRLLPRVWINITAPLLQVGKAYEVTISHFDDGDRVVLQLVPAPPRAGDDAAQQPFTFQSAPRNLHTYRSFDASKGNETWVWAVSPLMFKTMPPGPYFLKALDAQQPGRFVLSQAFDVEDAAGKKRRHRRRATAAQSESSSSSTSNGRRILRRLSGAFTGGASAEPEPPASRRRRGGRRRELEETIATGGGSSTSSKAGGKDEDKEVEEDDDGSAMDDVALMNGLLTPPQDRAATADLWRALLASTGTQRAFKDATLARLLLDKAPVLRGSPAIKALDADGGAGWRDPRQVQGAVTTALGDFIEASVALMTSTGESRDWPRRVLEGLTEEEHALSQKVAREGDLDALRSIMDGQAGRLFPGVSMDQVRDMSVVDEFKALLRDSELLRNVVDDADLWKDLDF